MCAAWSGIAATPYVGGATAHSIFGFPLDLEDELCVWGITSGSQRAELIRSADLIIYDEVSMAHRYLIEMLDRSLRDLCEPGLLFGGKPVLLCGDFRQLAPVVQDSTPSQVVAVSLKCSPLPSTRSPALLFPTCFAFIRGPLDPCQFPASQPAAGKGGWGESGLSLFFSLCRLVNTTFSTVLVTS